MNLLLDWGPEGLRALAGECDVLIVVDVLSFSTCVEVALSRGASVIPHRFSDPHAAALARQAGALLAGPRSAGGYSLSPSSVLAIPPGQCLLLPSPNGGALCLAGFDTGLPVFTGCLRNAAAVARAVSAAGRRIGLFPAGERRADGSLRFALEDWLGAGAIAASFTGSLSPEAEAAKAGFLALRERLPEALRSCESGRELLERGYGEDVRLASALDVSGCAPRLVAGSPARFEPASQWPGAVP